MTKRGRMVLWLLLTFLFFVFTPSIILYSQGYRVDWKLKKIVQTGALYFKVVPTRTTVLVDGKTSKTTDFFFGSALLGNLFPGLHSIQISKEGYQPWAKQLEIQEKQVTDAKNILLFPEKPEFSIAADHVQNIWETPKANTLLLQKGTQDTWKLILLNTESLREETVFSPKTKSGLLSVQWSPDGTWIILQIALRENISSFIVSLEKNQPCNASTPCDLAFLGQPLDTIAFLDAAEHRVVFSKYVRNSVVLGQADFVKQEILEPIASNVTVFGAQGSRLTWLENTGKLWQKDTLKDPSRSIASLPSLTKEEIEYEIYEIGGAFFLKEGTRLLMANTQEKNMEEVFSDAHMVKGSPDAKKLAIANEYEVWVVYLQDSQGQPMHRAKDRVFLTRVSKAIDNLSWVSSHYLVFSAGEDIRAMEIDERDAINTAQLAQFQTPMLFWQQASKILAVLSQGNLYVSEGFDQ